MPSGSSPTPKCTTGVTSVAAVVPLLVTVRWSVTRSPSGMETSGPVIVTSRQVAGASVASPASARSARVAGALSASPTPSVSATSGWFGVESGSSSAVSFPEVNVVSAASAPASVGGSATIALETSGSVPRSASSGRVPIDLVARARGVAVPLEGPATERRGASGSGWGKSPSGRGMFASAVSRASRIGRRTMGAAGRRAGWRDGVRRAGAAAPTGVGSATGVGMAVSSAVVATSDGTSAESPELTSTSPAAALSAEVGEAVAPPSSPVAVRESRSSTVVGSASSEGAAVTIRSGPSSPLPSCARSASLLSVAGVAFGSAVSSTATAATASTASTVSTVSTVSAAARAGAAAGRRSSAGAGTAWGTRRRGVRLACIEGRGAGTRPSARGMFSSRAWRRSSGVIAG